MSTVTVTCTVELNSAILQSDLTLLMVSTQLTHPNGTMLSLSNTIRGTTFTYTTQLNSFGRSDSGNYKCTAGVRLQPIATFLMGSDSRTSTAKITTIPGVYLTLGGEIYNNGSNILIDEIGEGDEGALLCITDLLECCHSGDTPGEGGPLGKWFYPNESLVQVKDRGDDFYRNRGTGVVRLNRRNNATSPTGQFCCVVPDATLTNRTTCIDIGEKN